MKQGAAGLRRKQIEGLWTVADLAAFLGCPKNGIYNMIGARRITSADGLLHIFSDRVRFDPDIVRRRIREGIFGKGLDDEGKPMDAKESKK